MPSSTATISKDQRDGLYALVRNHLGGLSDVFVEMEQRRDFDAAERLGREFAEDFRLLDDIGWQPNDGREAVALTMPLGELLELLQRLQDEAERLLTESPPSAGRGRKMRRRIGTFASASTPARAFWPTLIAKAADQWSPRPRSLLASPRTCAAAANGQGSPRKSSATERSCTAPRLAPWSAA